MSATRMWWGGLAAVVVVYLVLGASYAYLTPPWQTPDEPAHYNVIAQMAQGVWPTLQAGDYNQAYLEQLVGRGFPPDLPVDGVRYQDYQPPLYYVLALPAFWLSGGALVAVRLFSVLLGAGVVVFTALTARAVWPHAPVLSLAAAGFVAFIPQHIAMLAGVNNDALSELLVAAGLWWLTRHTLSDQPLTNREAVMLGLIVGAALLTKVQAYVLLPVAVLALALRADRARAVRPGALMLALALGLGALYWGRNWLVCGAGDLLCGNLHNQVVVGQPTTTGWIAQFGLDSLLWRGLTFTFQSFWGVFGWMGVFMDARLYLGLLVFTGLVLVGVLGAARGWRGWSPATQRAVLVLAASATLTLGLYLVYNLSFVQHQGRYLFPALVPLSVAVAAGLRQWARWLRWPPAEAALAALMVAGLAGLSAWALVRVVVPALG